MPYYIAAFVVLTYLQGRGRGWKRTLVALLGGALATELIVGLLGWLPTMMGLGEGYDSEGSGLPGWAWQALRAVIGVVGLLMAFLAVRWLKKAPPVTSTAKDAPVVLVSPAALAPTPPAPDAGLGLTDAAPPAPVETVASAPLDATAAETLRILVVGLSDPHPEVRRDCAALMQGKFLPALAHEPDAATRQAGVATVRALAAEARPPRDAAEERALAHAVALYTRLTTAPGEHGVS